MEATNFWGICKSFLEKPNESRHSNFDRGESFWIAWIQIEDGQTKAVNMSSIPHGGRR